MEKFAVVGDLHGNLGWCRHVIKAAAREGISTIFQVGDAGFCWPGRDKFRFDAKLSRLLIDRDIRLIFIAGNHDNHDELEALEVGSEGLAKLREGIFLLPRGGRINHAGLTIGGLGGAYSIDRKWRTEGADWWAQEEVQPDDVAKLAAGGPVDVLFTHDVPDFVTMKSELDLPVEESARADVSRVLLTGAILATRPRHVFCGHWHMRKIAEVDVPYGSLRVDVLHQDGSRWGNAVQVACSGGLPLTIEPLEIVS
ncbi:metallophosphoesterase family protein [Crystallibacter crystallopoietes]|nr:metallophosphoesterase family protein [Arthrobacter crystallopoietes]